MVGAGAKESMAKRKRTKRKTAAKAESKTTHAIEAALAGIAHDIRTPLTGIVALADLLAADWCGIGHL